MPPVNRLTDLQVRESPSACVLPALAVRLRIAELCATSEIGMEHDISAVFHGDICCHALLYLCLCHFASHTIINVIAISTTSRTMPCSYGETSPSFFPILPPLLLVTAPIEDFPPLGVMCSSLITPPHAPMNAWRRSSKLCPRLVSQLGVLRLSQIAGRIVI